MAEVGGRVDRCLPLRQQELRRLGVTLGERHVQGRVPRERARVDCRARPEQAARDVAPVVLSGEVERREPGVGPQVDGGPVLQEQLEHAQLPLLCGHVQGGCAQLSLGVDRSCASLEQQPRLLELPALCRKVQLRGGTRSRGGTRRRRRRRRRRHRRGLLRLMHCREDGRSHQGSDSPHPARPRPAAGRCVRPSRPVLFRHLCKARLVRRSPLPNHARADGAGTRRVGKVCTENARQ